MSAACCRRGGALTRTPRSCCTPTRRRTGCRTTALAAGAGRGEAVFRERPQGGGALRRPDARASRRRGAAGDHGDPPARPYAGPLRFPHRLAVDKSLLMWTDVVHLPAIQFKQPEAGVGFDVDGDQARATRKAHPRGGGGRADLHRRLASRIPGARLRGRGTGMDTASCRSSGSRDERRHGLSFQGPSGRQGAAPVGRSAGTDVAGPAHGREVGSWSFRRTGKN